MTIDQLAAQIRKAALSGYSWFVPPTLEQAEEHARQHWRIKAMEQLDRERELAK